MAIFDSRETLQARLQTLIGERTDDEALNFVQDALETYDARPTSEGISQEEHDRLMKEQDESWRKKYRDTFFGKKPEDSSFDDKSRPDPSGNLPNTNKNNPANFDDLFGSKGE